MLSLIYMKLIYNNERERDVMRFEIYKDNKNKWRWRGKTDTDEIFAESGEGYTEKNDCLSELDLFKHAEVEDIKIYADKDGLHRWTFQKDDGEIIADSSEGFYDKNICKAVVETIVKEVQEAEVVSLDSM